MRNILLIAILFISLLNSYGQAVQYEVDLTPIVIPELGGLQSYAVATYQGEWLIIGGRLDGLHRRQPFAAFSKDGNNEDILVVNPISKKVWKKSVSSLPPNLKEQLASTNMQFYQDEDQLILTGGYGYSPTFGDHITYPNLTLIDVPNVIQSVKNGVVSKDDFQQIVGETFQVTGGRLGKIDDVYYLVGGHKFMGRYNPMGPTHGPGFEQDYSNEIRKFTLTTENELTAFILTPDHDELHLHRRDYNLVPTIMNDSYGLMVYSGVFQNNADVPWLYPVQITEEGYQPREEFTQYFNHYHCATVPIYNESKGEMHTLFFGGIAQFYMDGDMMVQDNDVPFVNTITDVYSSSNGELKETVLETQMPGYLGAGSEFIFDSEVSKYDNGILSGEEIGEEFAEVGYIYGGIRSSLPNIFWINEGTESEASSTIYKVSIRKRKPLSIVESEVENQKLFFYPNPALRQIRMGIEMTESSDVDVEIFDTNGEKIYTQKILKSEVNIGKNTIVMDKVDIGFGAFIYKVKFGNTTLTRKVIWAE